MADERMEQMDLFEFDKPVIKGYPELRWSRKRPYTSTQFFPAQLKEKYGEPDESGWFNKIFWGDNLQVMSHLLKEYRGKIDLIYIDPPFDSKADYKKTIKIRGLKIESDSSTFEEKQYGDIWTNDEYLQFMYERFILLRELLSDRGSIYVHCDWHKSHQLRCIMDEVFGPDHFCNEIVWRYRRWPAPQKAFQKMHDTILKYKKGEEVIWNQLYEPKSESTLKAFGDTKLTTEITEKGTVRKAKTEATSEGTYLSDVWELPMIQGSASKERDSAGNYPTQKPMALLEKIILSSSNPGDIVFDCFMGSGTTQVVALKNNRRFIGADINLGAIQTTTRRLVEIYQENSLLDSYAGFEVFNVNNYDFFRNQIEARDLLIEALNIQKYASGNVFDGELDGRNVKILPVNRIATKADLGELVANLPYKTYEKRKEESPNDPVDRITLVCMGHEPDLKAGFEQMVGTFRIDVEIVDILRDKSALEFKREATAKVELKHDDLIIKEFYPMNLLQKLSIQKENVDEWRQLVDSIMIDYNYNGETLNPQIIDIPEKNDLVKGRYNIPKNHGRIKVKITDLLSESLEVEVK